MPGYDSWKTRSPDDGQYDPETDEPPSREQEEANYLDEKLRLKTIHGREMGTRYIDMPITFGKKKCQIDTFSWDEARKVADISYHDERGERYATTALSMDLRDIRRAVLDAMIADYNRP